MLTARNCSVRFGDTLALDSVTFEPPDGRTTVLIGPSGCGKSTLLRVLIGLVQPQSGEVTFDGTRLDAATQRKARERTGYVIQDGGLFPHLTVRDNVTLMARQFGRQVDLKALAALMRLDVALLERFPAELSGGQRQRVSLMRALALEPALLLLDEPLGSLDPMVRAELQHDLRDVFRSLRKTVVMVTHDLAEAAYFADFVVLLRAGRIEQQGPFASLTEAPATPFVTEFVTAQSELHRMTQ